MRGPAPTRWRGTASSPARQENLHLPSETREVDPGPRVLRVRVAVEGTDGLLRATAVEVGPLTVVAERSPADRTVHLTGSPDCQPCGGGVA